MPVCSVCSGTDFVCESGFYYCSECQTQSQDIREEIHDQDGVDEGAPVVQKRKRSSIAPPKAPMPVEENMTSWEGFNYALVGLVNELISLGADPALKKAVLRIWTTYLAKLEVAFTSKTEPAIPKLGPNFKQYDAEIIFGYSEKKARREERKRKKTEEKQAKKKNDNLDDLLNDTANSEEALRKMNLKRKRVAIRMDYEKAMHEMSLASQTLTDVTLEMLAVRKEDDDPEEKDEKKERALQFAEEGSRFKEHLHHVHPGILSRNKLPAILYLGLLMTRDKIKLSDLIRWMWEGHVSFSYLWKFLPPEVKLIGETQAAFGALATPTSYHWVLEITQQLGNYIDVKAVKAPCLEEMIKHYTAELNLPDQIRLIALRLLALLPNIQNSAIVAMKDKLPNWEGIAMAHIIIALKILFGLDDCTENQNSKVARRINELIASQHGSVKLFVWDDWVHFSTLRRTALMLLHDRSSLQNKLPTSAVQNIGPVIALWKKKHPSNTISLAQNKILLMETHKKVVAKLQGKDPMWESDDIPLTFPPSLSPLSDYTKIIIKACQDEQLNAALGGEWGNAVSGLNLDMLSENFSSTLVDYLTHPESYVEWAQQHGLRVGLHNGSAVNVIKYPESEKPKHWKYNHLFFYRVKLLLSDEDVTNPCMFPKIQVTEQSRSFKCHKPIIHPKTVDKASKGPLPTISEMTDHAPEKIIKSKIKCKKPVLKSSYEDLAKEDEDNMLHTPHTEYWMLHFADTHEINLNPGTYSDYKRQLPESFVFLLEECALLLEMEPAQLYRDVSNLEALHKDLSKFDDESKPVATNLDKYGKERYVNYLKNFW